MEEANFIINTTMTKEDYRRFLYIATFRRNRITIPILLIISLVGSLIISFENGHINYLLLIISWILLFCLSIFVVVLKVEQKNRQRIKTDKTGTFDSINTLYFFEDKMVIENKDLKSTGQLKYDQFFSLLESRDYFIFYLTMNQASLVRKVDVESLSELRGFIINKFEGRYYKIRK